MSTNRNLRFTPLWMAICVVIGILIGSFYANHFSGNRLNIINSTSSTTCFISSTISMSIP